VVICLTSARFNMKADILRQNITTPNPPDPEGEWTYKQDESGEIIRVWQPGSDNPDTVENEAAGLESFRCEARGIIDGGIRVAGTTERFTEIYENVDYVKISFPASVRISKRDRITNIRDPKGNIIWKEEEQPSAPPTVFNVMGVTPVIDPFGRHIESQALLERAERQ
jgi:hypothetical protein